MTKSTTQEISVSCLAVNTENPRFDIAADQREAVSVMLKDQGSKIVNLAKDIVENGLNPSDLTIVSPLANEKGMYNVLEGNRRIMTLKLLLHPDLANPHHKSLYNKFKELQKKHKGNDIKKVPCVIYDNPEDAYRWIKLKHTGENEGVGTVRWDAQQVARFDERIEGRSAIALQAIDFLNKSQEVDQDTKANLNKLPLTNMDRLLTDNNIQDVVGIKIEDGRLKSTLAEKEVVKGLVKIAKDLISKKVKVKDIYTKKDREKYIESFKQGEIPKKSNVAAAQWELIAPNKIGQSRSNKPRSIPLSTARKTVLPRDCILRIKEKRINLIYQELKNLNCEDFTNAAAILMRVFVELSADSYLKKIKISQLTKDSRLNQKINGIADFLEQNGTDKHELKGIRIAASSKNNVISIDTFNAYVHNTNYTPIANDLKVSWDNIQPFICTIWENL